MLWSYQTMILKKGLWLESNNGAKWKVIDIKNGKFTIRRYYKGENVGTITGISLKDIRKYFKT